MTPIQTKIIHVILNNVEGYWKSINLSNMAVTITPAEAQQVMDHVHPKMVVAAEAKVKMYKKIPDYPDCIMDIQLKSLKSLKNKVHPALSSIKKRAKQEK